jgi:hypothetical protein
MAYIRGEALEPVLDVHSGGSSRLRFTMRTTLRGAGYTDAEPERPDWIPDTPPTTVTCLD